MAAQRVVFDGHLLLDISAHADPDDWRGWPNVPPVSDLPVRDCMGIIASSPRHGQDVQVVLCPQLLAHVAETLKTVEQVDQGDVDGFLLALLEMAEQAGLRAVADPPIGDIEVAGVDGVALRLAAAGEERGLLVTTDADLLRAADVWTERGIQIVDPPTFSQLIEGRRAAKLGRA